MRYDTANYESGGTVKIIDSKITQLELVERFNTMADSPVYVYSLEYRLLPDDLSKVVLAGGMQVDEDGWLKETSSMGSPLACHIPGKQPDSTYGHPLVEEGGDLETSLKALLELN